MSARLLGARSWWCPLVGALALGCGPQGRASKAPSAAEVVDPTARAIYDGAGEPSSLEAFVADLDGADLVAFGELHFHPVSAELELALLEALAADERPVILAMEFFEADQQADLDRYLSGEIDEATFRERTHRDERYATSHRPLIEFCKAHGIRVLAANAPRRLVRGFRTSGKPYADYLAGLSAEDRALLPRTYDPQDHEFERRFLEFMGPKRGPAFYPAMALWNEAMAEAMADAREEDPSARVLLVVGGFHVAAHLGTVTSYTRRRPDDRVRVLLMLGAKGTSLELEPDERGEGDLLVKVHADAK